MSSGVKQRDFSPVYGQTNVCTGFLSSEWCSPLAQVWLTSFTEELKIITDGTNICGFLKMLVLYWFSIFKRKICKGLDTWKKAQMYIRCLSPVLTRRKHPFCAHLKVVEGAPLSRWLPPALTLPVLCWKMAFAPAGLLCACSCAALAWEK